MRQMVRSVLMMIVGLLALGATAEAALVSIDVDRITAGIQSTNLFPVMVNDIVTVDVVVSGILASDPLNGFEFDVDFFAAVLSATSVVDGGFLLNPFPIQNTIGAGFVDFAETALGGFVSGGGVLATITFQAMGPGTSPLDLNSVILANGVHPILPLTVNDGSITVVPIPGAALLFGTGLIGLIAIARRKSLRTKN